jgi:ATP-dependent RNA helicase DDX46/PRP5
MLSVNLLLSKYPFFQMEALARRILQYPVELAVGGKSIVCKDVSQHVHLVDDETKFLKLLEILGEFLEDGVAIIFVDKQEHADSLLKDLMNAGYHSCGSLHGGIDQYDRDSIITDFKAGKLKVLVATSVAARGLDVKELELVVNYDCPNHYEDYVHRCGRTGRAGNKGAAHTLLTPEQGRYAGDLVKAFELSECLVPADLRAMWTEYKEKMAAEGKTVKSGGGFGGSGFKFDENEASYTTEKKKFQKTVFGLQDSDDEDIEGDLEAQIEQLLDSKRSVKTVSAAEAAGAIPGVTVPAAAENGATPSSVSDKLELAKRLASKINLKSNAAAQLQQTTESFLAGKPGQPMITAKTVADHLAAQLNAKLNYQPLNDPTENADLRGDAFQKYEEELIINDFPQQARWRVTSKEALAQISEYSDAGITVRGTYFPPNKQVQEGERKLFLAIESTNELAVQKAKVEIMRLLKEELLKMQTSGFHQLATQKPGRYKVL